MSDYIIETETNKSFCFDEIVEFLSKVFGPNYFEAKIVQRKTLEQEPSLKPENFIIARAQNGLLIGVVRIVERDILLEDTRIKMGCISSVSVHSDWRGKQVATGMLNHAFKVMKNRHIDIATLYSRRIQDGFYVQFGFHGIGRYLDLSILSRIGKDTRLVCKPCEESNLHFLQEQYFSEYGQLSGSIYRNKNIWRYVLYKIENGIGSFEGCMLSDGNHNIGYLIKQGSRLVEIAISKEYLPDLPGLLNTIGVNVMSIHPRHSFSIYCRSMLNSIQSERFVLDGGYMGRIINMRSLLEKMLPLFIKRADRLGLNLTSFQIHGYKIDFVKTRISKSQLDNGIQFDNLNKAILLLLNVFIPKNINNIDWKSVQPWVYELFPLTYFHTSQLDEV